MSGLRLIKKWRLVLATFGLLGLTLASMTVFAAAPNASSGDGFDHLSVNLTNTSSPAGYTVKATRTINNASQTINFTYDSGHKIFYSGPIMQVGDNCNSPTGQQNTRQQNQVQITAYQSGKQVGTSLFDFCQRGAGASLIYSIDLKVSATPITPASVTSQLKFTSDAGGVKPFGSTASGQLTELTGSHQVYQLKFDNSGNITPLTGLTPGKYTFTAQYLPTTVSDGPQVRPYSETFTLASGQKKVISSTVTVAPGAGGAGGAGPSATPTHPTCENGGVGLNWILTRR